MNQQLKGTGLVLICVALWALIPVVAKLGQTRLDHHQFLFWSSLVSFGVLLGATTLRGELAQMRTYRRRDWGWLIFLGLLGTYIYYLLLYLGYATATGLAVLVMQYSWPLLIVLFSYWLLKEPLTAKKLIALALGFVGVALVLTKGNVQQLEVDNLGVIALVGAGAACFALFSVLSKSVTLEPLGVTSVYFLAAGIASWLSMLIFSKFSWPTTPDLWPILLNGVLVNGFSYVFWLLALRTTEASYLAPFTYLSPVLAAFYLVIFFQEPFLPVYGVGLLCVVLAGLVNSLAPSLPNDSRFFRSRQKNRTAKHTKPTKKNL
jgi:drug/metabolite transporter (DMT)-like permease